jgi:membrane protease YdiL (CAAX protease family)
MREHEPRACPFGPPRGKPERPLLEAGVLLAAFYLPAYVPVISKVAATDMSKFTYYLAIFAVNAPRAALILYLMAAGDGLRPFGIRRFLESDILKALFATVGALAAMLGSAFAFSAIGIENPFMTAARSGPRASPMLIPLILASSLSVGYCEELFFRSYLMRRLGQAGLTPLWAAVASSLLFGAGHGYQGLVGLVSGTILGLFFSWLWNEDADIHAIAIGHGLYDSIITSIAIYS